MEFYYPLGSREEQGQSILGNLLRVSPSITAHDNIVVETGEGDVVDTCENALNETQASHLLEPLIRQLARPREHPESINQWQTFVQALFRQIDELVAFGVLYHYTESCV